jgi:hypothetical protein
MPGDTGFLNIFHLPDFYFCISAEGLKFIAAWIETEVMKWWEDSVQNCSFGVYRIPYPTYTGCLLAINTTLIMYIPQFLKCVTVLVLANSEHV